MLLEQPATPVAETEAPVAESQPDNAESATPPPVEAPTPEQVRAESVAARLELVAKRDRQVRKKEQELKAQEGKITEASKMLEIYNDEAKLIEHLEKKNPELFKKWATKILGEKEPQLDDSKKALNRIEELEKKLAEKERQATEREQVSAWSKFQNETAATVRSNPEYALIVAEEAEFEVAELIKIHYNETREELKVDEAARMVNKYLSERYKKLSKHDVIRKLIAASQDETAEKPAQIAAKDTSGKPKTITSRAASAPVARVPKKDMSADEHWEQILSRVK